MMHAALASSPSWADLRRTPWSNAGWRPWRAWPIAAAWTPMAAVAMARACWSALPKAFFRKDRSRSMGSNCPTSLASAWCFFSVARKMQALDAIRVYGYEI